LHPTGGAIFSSAGQPKPHPRFLGMGLSFKLHPQVTHQESEISSIFLLEMIIKQAVGSSPCRVLHLWVWSHFFSPPVGLEMTIKPVGLVQGHLSSCKFIQIHSIYF
jgi:hypothetical protein